MNVGIKHLNNCWKQMEAWILSDAYTPWLNKLSGLTFTHKTQPATVRLWEILYMFVGGLNISTGDWVFWLGWTTNYGGLHTSHNTTRAGLMLNNNIWYINIMVIISEYFGNIWTGWTKTYGGLHTSHNTTYVHTYACTHNYMCVPFTFTLALSHNTTRANCFWY